MPLAIAAYTWLKAFHVLAVVGWVGSGAFLTVLALRAQRARDPEELVVVVRQAAFAGTAIFAPLSLAALGLGIGAIEEGGLGWGAFWVQFGTAVWAASTLIGAGFLGPQSKRVAKLLETRAAADPEVQAGIRRLLLAARADVVLLLAAVFVMTAKPWS